MPSIDHPANGNTEPVKVTPLPYLADSANYYRAIRHLPLPVWLDSCNSVYGRFDILSAAPSSSFHVEKDSIKHYGEAESLIDQYCSKTNNPFDILEKALSERAKPLLQEAQIQAEVPFYGGAIGFLSYDMGRYVEQIPMHTPQALEFPRMVIGIYEWAIIQDHKQKCSWFVQTPNADQYCIDNLLSSLPGIGGADKNFSSAKFQLLSPFKPEQSYQDYQHAIQKIQDYILAGDCYQVNYTQRYTANYTGDLLSAYLSLRKAVPSPFSAFMELAPKYSTTNHQHKSLISLSPEQFISVKQGNARTRPIKGTRARHDSPELDKAAAEDLLLSTKDQAENVMIVDLLRNDFSRNCRTGTVKTPELFALQSFRNVHHLVSTVTGELEKGRSSLDLLRGCFPGGSITGAPKKRAMEIIEELEPCQRSAYCGSALFISDCGNMDSSITIRTLVADEQQLHCWGGGAITAGSSTKAEYQESIDKITALMKALET